MYFFRNLFSHRLFSLNCSRVQTMSRNSSSYKVLNVAEKNDAAKRISGILSSNDSQRREGMSKYNKIYEFSYQMFGRDCHMVMTSLSGHMMNFDFVGTFRKWYSCHPQSLFSAEIRKTVTENMIQIKKTLERECRSCQALVIWTDGDREGENIGYEIIDTCLAIKPSLAVYRAKFSEITNRSIKAACCNLVRPNKNVSDAVDVRQELDLRIGAAFTRFQTLRLQKVFPQVLSQRLISYGSCQFPTLGFVVERFKARESFQSEKFWKIEVTHVRDDCVANFNWKRHRLFAQLPCQVLYKQCSERPAIAKVINIQSKPKSKWRPVALDTVELEKLSSRKLRISAKETMKIAEKLYTNGYISYPRTETNKFPKEIDLNHLVEEQAKSNTWSEFAQNLLEIGLTPRNGNKTDNAHPPIHPTKCGNDLSGNEGRVYELIARHFLGCCHRDAQGHETTVEIQINGEEFTAQGLMIIARNYLEIYIYDKWNAKTLPIYKIGEQFQPSSLEMTDGETTPPSLLTEADLISLMDKHGIGTDATHAEHIETIKSRMYIGVTPDRKLLPGELGMGLVEGYDLMGFHLSKPNLRADLEADLKLICDGTASKRDVLSKHTTIYKEVFEASIRQAGKLDEALLKYFGSASSVSNEEVYGQTEESPTVRRCPECGRDMILKKKRDGGLMISCNGYPECKCVSFLPKSVLEAKVDESLCSICRPAPVHRLKLKLNRSSIPPYMNAEQVACVCGCNEDITNALDIRFRSTSSSNSYSRPASSYSSGRGSGGGGPGFLGTAKRGTTRGRGGRGSGTKRSLDGRSKYSTATNSSTDSGYSGSSSGFSTQNSTRLTNDSNHQPNANVGNIPQCKCGVPAVERTVFKDGHNKGKKFYTCLKPQGEQCRFFEWKDGAGQGQQSNRGRRQNRGAASRGHYQGRGGGRGLSQSSNSISQASSGTRRERRPPKCSVCRETGHTKRTCPNK